MDIESGRLFEVGAYSGKGAYKICTIFNKCRLTVVCIFCKKTVNGNNKTRRCNKARFLQNTLKKTPSSGKSLISTYSFLGGGSGKGVGAYLRLSGSGGGALILFWAPINFFCL